MRRRLLAPDAAVEDPSHQGPAESLVVLMVVSMRKRMYFFLGVEPLCRCKPPRSFPVDDGSMKRGSCFIGEKLTELWEASKRHEVLTQRFPFLFVAKLAPGKVRVRDPNLILHEQKGNRLLTLR